ncbi:MAG: ATP-binding protein [Caulobacteraceae bacterium]|nr:ATP-binding protein [Caulobacteraceae bacterium]
MAQAALIAILCWQSIGGRAALAWMAVMAGSALVDVRIARRYLRRPGDLNASAAVCVCLLASATAFASVGVILLSRASAPGLAEAALVLCAINLHNAMITRASRLAALLLLGPSASILVATPFLCGLFGHPVSLVDALTMEAGAVIYLAFIGRMASALQGESQAVRRALEDQGRERRRAEFAMEEAVNSRARWRMVFDQSPLPQSCFDASRLHMMLRPHIEAGETCLGDVARVLFACSSETLPFIVLGEANEAAEILLAVDRSDGLIDPAQFHPSFVDGFCEGLNGMDEDGVLAPFETKIVRPSGELVELRVHARMPPGQEPPWNGCMISYVDMTGARRAAAAQQAAVEAAESANRAKSEFLAVMSHEIRTPLNGVLGMAQAMALEPLSPVQTERLGVIRQSGEALLELLNDLLDLSKIEAGKLDLEVADFDLEAVARGVQAAFGAVAVAKGLSLDVTVERRARRCFRGDAARVRQVVNNLVANAVKFTEAGSVRLRVSADETVVRIAVRDTGIGIEADRIPRLFEKFVQADSSTTRRFGGTGLGLAICRELCKAMGGSIRVESRLGVGSTFIAELPLAPAATAAQPVRLVATGRRAAPRLDALRVLAAEDNPVNQLVLKTLLAQVGVEPALVGNGAEAVRAFEPGAWDLILMDVQMPVMDGPAAARAIRVREAASGAAPTRIVALTANAMSHQVEAYLAAGMDGILAKPIEVAQLYAAMAAAAPKTRSGRRRAA